MRFLSVALAATCATFALSACAASEDVAPDEDDADAVLSEDELRTGATECRTIGDPCVRARHPAGELGLYCYRKLFVDAVTRTRAKVRLTMDHGASGIVVAPTVADTRSYSAAPERLNATFGLFGPGYRVEIERSARGHVGKLYVPNTSTPIALRCERGPSGPVGRSVGQSCKHPTSNAVWRCGGGLTCDTNGADHIEAAGVCRTR